MGSPVDLKFFIKQCHRRGIRVILDVVMNHSAVKCPLLALAEDWFYLPPGSTEEGDRPDWGGRAFRYVRPTPDGHQPAREFHYRMAEFWVREYHVDGFRIDEFKGINNWEFVQTFRERAWAEHGAALPGPAVPGRRRGLVAARRGRRRTCPRTRTAGRWPTRSGTSPTATRSAASSAPGSRRSSASRRGPNGSAGSVSGSAMWDDYGHSTEARVHRPRPGDQLRHLARRRRRGRAALPQRRLRADPPLTWTWAMVGRQRPGHASITSRARATRSGRHTPTPSTASAARFALLMTSVGIPMFLAGRGIRRRPRPRLRQLPAEDVRSGGLASAGTSGASRAFGRRCAT